MVSKFLQEGGCRIFFLALSEGYTLELTLPSAPHLHLDFSLLLGTTMLPWGSSLCGGFDFLPANLEFRIHFAGQFPSHFSFTFLPSGLKPRIDQGRKFCVLFRGAVLPGFLWKRVIGEPWWDYFEIPGLPSRINPLPGSGRTPLPAPPPPPAGILIFPIHSQASSFAERRSARPQLGEA